MFCTTVRSVLSILHTYVRALFEDPENSSESPLKFRIRSSVKLMGNPRHHKSLDNVPNLRSYSHSTVLKDFAIARKVSSFVVVS